MLSLNELGSVKRLAEKLEVTEISKGKSKPDVTCSNGNEHYALFLNVRSGTDQTATLVGCGVCMCTRNAA